MGSNAIRFVVGENDPAGNIRVLNKFRAPIRLGADVFSTGRISRHNIKRTCAAFVNFREVIDAYEVEKIEAVATSAAREATNGREMIAAIERHSGIRVRIINGIEEAEHLFYAVHEAIDLRKRHALLIDIGGGSVEFSTVHHSRLISCKSFPIGTVRLLQQLERTGLPEKRLNEVMFGEVQRAISYLVKYSRKIPFTCCVGTGGNMRALGKLGMKLHKNRTSTELKVSQLASIRHTLEQNSYRERMRKFDLRADRADVIYPAAFLLQSIMQEFSLPHIYLPKVGLYEGLLQRAFEKILYENIAEYS